MTTSVNQSLTSAETIFYNLIWTPMITAGENYIEGEIPFLDLPVIKQLDEATITLITDAIFNQIILLIDVSAIQLINAEHQSAYDAASEQLVIIAQEKGITSSEFLQAQAAALVAMSQFTRFSH
jgi:hypothetical protein